MESIIHLAEAASIILLVNVPFGYWRANVKKYAMQWFLAIHIPVPIVIAVRLLSNIGFHWTSYPIMIVAFFLGQYVGGLLYKWRKRKHTVSSCLVMDIMRPHL